MIIFHIKYSVGDYQRVLSCLGPQLILLLPTCLQSKYCGTLTSGPKFTSPLSYPYPSTLWYVHQHLSVNHLVWNRTGSSFVQGNLVPIVLLSFHLLILDQSRIWFSSLPTYMTSPECSALLIGGGRFIIIMNKKLIKSTVIKNLCLY